MGRQIISTESAPSSPLYSQGVRSGSTIHVSGMVGIDMATGELAGPTIQEQTLQALRNCEAILVAGGSDLAEVALVTVLLARPDDFMGMNEAYAGFFGETPPARAVTRLGPELPGILVSVMMMAQVDPAPRTVSETSKVSQGNRRAMGIGEWWPRLNPSARAWLIAHNGEALSAKVIDDITGAGAQVDSDQEWMGKDDRGGLFLSDAAVDWIEAVANDEPA